MPAVRPPVTERPAPPPLSLTTRRKRLKIDVACDRCRSRKVKCDGVRPACGNCSRKLDLRDKCHYESPPQPSTSRDAPMLSASSSRVQGQPTGHFHTARIKYPIAPLADAWSYHKASAATRPLAAKPPSNPASARQLAAPDSLKPHGTAGIDSMTAVVENEATTEFFGSSSAGSFTTQIKAAIDARLGHTPPKQSSSDSATGPPSPLNSFKAARRSKYDPKNVLLPTKRLADELMHTYWHYIDPLYPFLDKLGWENRYTHLFAGKSLNNTDESIFLASLNIVFALSTQLHEGQDATVRNDSSQDYFRRAQDLVDITIWDPGSLEMIQYLLITSQYLQSTNLPHQTWMVVGLAVRTAQSLGLHLPETSAAMADASKRQLYRTLWHGCVLMDRMVALTHGRPAMVSAEQAAAVPLPTIPQDLSDFPSNCTDVSFFVKSAELYEITHRLVEKIYSTNSRDRQPQPHRRPVADLANIVQLDGDMAEWELTLPKHLQLAYSASTPSRTCLILRLRYLHARILLLRPMLSLVCLPDTSSESDTERLSVALYKQCALNCVATARSTIRIFFDNEVSDGTVGLLPAWWYRLYYLFSASTVLIAAKLRPDVFAPDQVAESWEQAMQVFDALQKVSYSAHKCMAALRILSSKILAATRRPAQHSPNITEGHHFNGNNLSTDFTSNQINTKILDGLDLNFDDIDFDFEVQNYSWLNEVTSWNILSG